MTTHAPAGRAARRALALALAGGATVLAACLPALAKLETWRDETPSAFHKARRDRVVVSDAGRVRLGQSLKPMGSVDAARVWDIARTPGGDLYAATGDAGKVFRRGPKDDDAWAVAHDARDSQALALVVGPEGHVFAGTGPGGQVVDLTDPKQPSARPHPGVQYVWDLAADPDGNLYAATGPTGQLWKRAASGAWSLLYDSKHAHLLCVAVGPDGSVYAGSDGEGLVYKVARGGKVSVVYDAPQNEVRALAVGPDGALYAGTAAEAGGGTPRGPSLFSGGSLTGASGMNQGFGAETRNAPALRAAADNDAEKKDAARKDEARPRSSASAGGTATPRAVVAGENAVYRIEPEGVAREVFRAKALVFALAVQKDRVLVGTGPEGQLYEVREGVRESSAVARLDNGQVLALLSEPSGGVLVGTGDPGSVVRLEPGHVASGTLVSAVRDAKLISRFGAIRWRADLPAGTAVTLQARSGNVAEPDATWSDWSPEQTDPENARADVPAGRFVQYRATLSTKDPAVTPELSAVNLRYQSANLAPEVSKLDVPDVSALDGATRKARMSFRWEVSDPNDDDMTYDLGLRKEGWPDWVKLNEEPLTEKSMEWDATSVPDGVYRVRLRASDRPSNNADAALSREKVSETFLVDHQAPEVTIKAGPRRASAVLRDGLTRIARASYAVDGGDWVAVFPEDGLFDTLSERLVIPLPGLKAGTHVLVIKATDAAGNVGAGDALIEVR